MKKICRLTIDGEIRECAAGTKFLSLVDDYKDAYDADIVLVRSGSRIYELNDEIYEDMEISFYTTADNMGKRAYRRSLSLLLVSAGYAELPAFEIRIQHSLGNGYYCELYQNGERVGIDEERLQILENTMRDMIARDLPIRKEYVTIHKASRWIDDSAQRDKSLILKQSPRSGINLYQINGYYDYYYGYMLPSTGLLAYFGLCLYQNGFMLLFPTKDARRVEPFVPLEKLFGAFEEAADWGRLMGIRTVGYLNEAIVEGRIQTIIQVHEALMEKKIADLAEQIVEDRRKKVVLIAGPSSSGKTTFSHRLAIQMMAKGLHPHPVAMDDFYVNRVDTPLDENGEYDYESIYALDLPLLNQSLCDLLDGKRIELPHYNFKSGKREYRGEYLQFKENDVLIMEGIHGLNEELTRQIPAESKFKIYISALTQLNIDYHNNLSTTDCRLIRRLVRDARSRNADARDTLQRWQSVRDGEERNIFPYQEQADVMFNSALIYEMSVLKVYAQPLLMKVPEDCPESAEAKRLLRFLDYFLPVPGEQIMANSLIREFVGGSCFEV